MKIMEAQDTTVGSQHTEAPAAAAVGQPTSNGTGVTLKFDGPLKRKRPADLVSDRYTQLLPSVYISNMRIQSASRACLLPKILMCHFRT